MKTIKTVSILMSLFMVLSILPSTALGDENITCINLALGKSSITSKIIDDLKDAYGWDSYMDSTDFSILTDGIYGNTKTWNDPSWFKFLRQSARELIFDLGEVDTINSLSMSFAQRREALILAPWYVKYYVSNDGTNYSYIGNATANPVVYQSSKDAGGRWDGKTNVDRKEYKLDILSDGSPINIQARYVKIVFNSSYWVFADEIEIIGQKGIVNGAVIPQSLPDENPIVNKYPAQNSEESAGVKDQFLMYTGPVADPNITNWTKDKVSYVLGYKDSSGSLKDWLFDEILVIPSPLLLNSVESLNKLGNKAQWINYLDFVFKKDDTQLDALNQVAKEINTSLNTNKKVKITMGIPYSDCSRFVVNYGDIDGDGINDSLRRDGYEQKVKDMGLDPLSVDGRLKMIELALDTREKAVKWYIDEVDRRFKEAGYENLELTNFYWFNEFFDISEGDDILIKETSKHLKNMGYGLVWIPYIGTDCAYVWKDLGFSAASIQPNYAWLTMSHYKKSMLPVAAEMAKKYGMGLEIEYGWSYKPDDPLIPDLVRKFSHYLNTGVSSGFMKNTFHTYYLNTLSLIDAAHALDSSYTNNNPDPRFRTLYDNIYKFINQTYTRKYVMDINPDLTDKKNIIVPISVLNADHYVEGSFSILYDASKVTYKDYELGDQLKDIGEVNVNTETPGIIKVSFEVKDATNALNGDIVKYTLSGKSYNQNTRSQIIKLQFGENEGVSDEDVTTKTFITNRVGLIEDIDGNVYLNWSESQVIPSDMQHFIIDEAKSLVRLAEDKLTQQYVDVAKTLVNELESKHDKLVLLNKLNAVQNRVNAKKNGNKE